MDIFEYDLSNISVDYNLDLSFERPSTIALYDRTIYRKLRYPIDISKNEKYLLVELAFGGLGQMINELINGIFIYLNSNSYYSKVYFILEEVEHDSRNTFEYIFPSIYTFSDAIFSNKHDYEIYKRNHPSILFEPFRIYGYYRGYIEYYKCPIMQKFIQDYIIINPVIESVYNTPDSLIKKTDLDTSIFVHIRYGDMLTYNLNCLNQGKRDQYILLHPDYYAKYIVKLYRESPSTIYIFSDTLTLVKPLLTISLRKYATEEEIRTILTAIHYPEEESATIRGAPHIVYIFKNCKRAIIGQSGLSNNSAFMNNRPDKTCIISGYDSTRIPISILKQIGILKLIENSSLKISGFTYIKKYKIEQKDYKLLTDVLYATEPRNKLKQIANLLENNNIHHYPLVDGLDGEIYNPRGVIQCAEWHSPYRTKIPSTASAAGGSNNVSPSRLNGTPPTLIPSVSNLEAKIFSKLNSTASASSIPSVSNLEAKIFAKSRPPTLPSRSRSKKNTRKTRKTRKY